MSDLRDEPATLYDLGLHTQAVGMAISALLDALAAEGIDARTSYSDKLAAMVAALDANPGLDPSEGSMSGVLRHLLLYAKPRRAAASPSSK